MILSESPRKSVVCAIFAIGAAASEQAAGALFATDSDPAGSVAAVAVLEKSLSDFAGLKPLVMSHRDEQIKMVKLWRTIKEGNGTDKTAAEYKAQQERVGKASEKVSEFIARDKWTAEDRAEMQRLWAAELEKPVE